ncbi:nuclear transport factor 2 family protein [Sphingomonas sp. SRS2]|uniref:nuclear transport factor 2 family protein n=1 Tax=Sphingomonas sp. SRS2 TaxID=133190 RepID=UPI0006184E00|nr:nuclear transport factor 2 family protein [Sphingomonas sp. SRS2]KKC27016.1 hypothetical protein WP12_06035 [Sphingomonas sp. SRS2]
MTDAEKLARIWDERNIRNTMLRFGETLDSGDWAAHRACFMDTANIDFERLTGQKEIRLDADLWVAFADAILSPVKRHHTYSNFKIEVDGDRALVTLKHTSRHWRSNDAGSVEYNQYGSYVVRFRRVDGVDAWKIEYLKHDFTWSNGNNALFDMHDPKLIEAMTRVFTPDHFAAAVSQPVA